MSLLITFFIGIFLCLLGKNLFRRWLNPILIYTVSWMTFIILYEIKLIRFIDIQNSTWVIILVSFSAFLLGILSFFSAGKLVPTNNKNNLNPNLNIDEKKIVLFLYIFSAVGLLVALQHWMVLINKFGNIITVFLRANLIYKMRVEGDIKGTIPYLNAFAYAGIFIGGVYTALKGKITFKGIFPFIVVILHDMASVGRAGIFMGFVLFVLTFFFVRQYFSANSPNNKLSRINFLVSLIVVVGIFLISTTLIKNYRGTLEKFKASTSTLNELERTYFISPSLYFYFSSNIGVLNKYFELGGEDKLIGENTFQPVYNLLSKINIVPHSGFYPKGYFVPIWSNSATYLRDLHEDFGYLGILIFPYLLGLFVSFFWFQFQRSGSLISLILLVYGSLIIAFSTFYIATRAAVFSISLVILLLTSRAIVVKKKLPNMHNENFQ